MYRRKCCVAAAIAVYLLLIALFVFHQHEQETDEKTMDFHQFLSVCNNENLTSSSENDKTFDQSDLNTWELFCCTWHSWISLVVSAFSTLLLIVTISGFVSRPSWNEKLSALFVSGVILFVCSPAIYNFIEKLSFSKVVFDIGGVLTVLALTILCFDAWQFSAQETQSQVDRRNKYFKIFAAVFVAFSTLYILLMLGIEDVETTQILFFGFFLLFFVILLADGVVLALAIRKACKESRAAAQSNGTWKNQKERLFIYLQLLAITFIILSVNTCNFWSYKGYTTIIIRDLINFFSAFLIFTVFVLDKKYRMLFEQQIKPLVSENTEIPLAAE